MKRQNITTSFSSILDVRKKITDKNYIIFGAGNVGQHLFTALKKIGLLPIQFWDNSACEDSSIGGISVTTPKLENGEEYSETLFLVATAYSNTSREITAQLNQVGINNIIDNPSEISAIIYATCQENTDGLTVDKCRVCPKFVIENGSCDIFVKHFSNIDLKTSEENLIIQNMSISITNLCSLRCKHCSETVEYHDPKHNLTADFEDLKQDIDTFFNAVDFIGQVGIVGGEAFIHKDLFKLMSYLKSFIGKKIATLLINTNGTVLPKSDEIFKLMADNPQTYIRISDYREFLNERQKKNVTQFIQKLKEYNVSYFFTGRHWFNYGDFSFRNYSEKEVQELYASCICSEVVMQDGHIYNCARGVYGNLLKKMPYYDSDNVLIRNFDDHEQLRQSLKKLVSVKYTMACQHCNGPLGPKIPAGEQARYNFNL